jgi:hypothetical protein
MGSHGNRLGARRRAYSVVASEVSVGVVLLVVIDVVIQLLVALL